MHPYFVTFVWFPQRPHIPADAIEQLTIGRMVHGTELAAKIFKIIVPEDRSCLRRSGNAKYNSPFRKETYQLFGSIIHTDIHDIRRVVM